VSPVRYELGFYNPEDGVLHVEKYFKLLSQQCDEVMDHDEGNFQISQAESVPESNS
jgi:hypothetical protein